MQHHGYAVLNSEPLTLAIRMPPSLPLATGLDDVRWSFSLSLPSLLLSPVLFLSFPKFILLHFFLTFILAVAVT